jgi:major vault protein
MGLYIKVIADYKTGNKTHIAGDELFITGDDTKIYFPRPEHAIIKYGKRTLHYAVAIPTGEARYVLDKTSGKVDLVKGPAMFMPDPRTQVIVKRVLEPKKVELMFPDNSEAIFYNQNLSESDSMNLGFVEDGVLNSKTMASTKTRGDIQTVGDELFRSSKYTKPRTIQLDSKYEGAVTVDVWPGYAIQIVKRTGERRVVTGPSTILLEFDEILESLSLSTGKPKSDKYPLKTVYLQTRNNTVSDIVEAETKDMVNVGITLAYRVNFEEEHKENWFGVQDYVKLLSQHLRSIVRNYIKKLTIQELNENFTDQIRDIILGSSTKVKGREGKSFIENGMNIYDVEVLNLQIGDSDIDHLLKKAERETVRQNLSLIQNEKNLEFNKRVEEMERTESEEKRKTEVLSHEQTLIRLNEQREESNFELATEELQQNYLDEIHKRTIDRKKVDGDQRLAYDDEKAKIEIKLVTEKLSAVSPKLSEALISMGNQHVMEVLAKNIKAQGGGLSNLFVKGGFGEILEAVKGTPIEEQFKSFFNDLKSEI